MPTPAISSGLPTAPVTAPGTLPRALQTVPCAYAFDRGWAGALGDAGRAADVPAAELSLSAGGADTVTVGGVVKLEWELESPRGMVPMHDEELAAMIEAAW